MSERPPAQADATGADQPGLRAAISSRWALAMALGITTAVLVGSLLPRVPMPPGPFSDKFLHMAGYAALGLAWRLALKGPTGTLLAAVFALGVAIECLQGLTPWRSFELADMLANGLGAAGGILLARGLTRRSPPRAG